MGNTSSDLVPAVKHTWAWRRKDAVEKLLYAHNPSLCKMDRGGLELLACAWQAAPQDYQGSDQQHIRFSISADGGTKWSKSRAVVWGLLPCWTPVVHYDDDADVLYLFYAESRKSRSPGGDIKYVTSTDGGTNWQPPVTIYTHEADGGVPKVLSCKLVVCYDGRWLLPFHREPSSTMEDVDSWLPPTAVTSVPSARGPAGTGGPRPPSASSTGSGIAQGVLPNGTCSGAAATAAGTASNSVGPPVGAYRETGKSSAGILVSRDAGRSWAAHGAVDHPHTALVDPTVVELQPGSEKLLMMLRSTVGKVFECYSLDGGQTWTPPFAVAGLPNPNSKVDALALSGQLLLAYNHSDCKRTPLALAVSRDSGASWQAVVSIDAGESGAYCNPSMVLWADEQTTRKELKVAYSYYGFGIKIASVEFLGGIIPQGSAELSKQLSVTHTRGSSLSSYPPAKAGD